MERIPPQNIEAEKSVLGSILIDNNTFIDVSEMLTPEDFYKPVHKEIFQAMTELNKAKEPIDVVTLSTKIDTDLAYIIELTDSTPTAANVRYYAKIVDDMSRLRKAIKGSIEVINKAYDGEDADEVIAQIEKTINEVNQKSVTTLWELPKILDVYLNNLEERYKNKGTISGVPTGFADLDIKLGGLQKGGLYLVGARPSMGKTAFAMNIAEFIGVVKRKPVAVFSLEMNNEQLMNRMVSAVTLIDSQRLRLGRLEDSDWFTLSRSLGTFDKAPVVIDDTPRTRIIDIEAKSKRVKNKYGELAAIIIDYLQLVTPASKGGSREQEVAEISRSLKILAKELECPVVCLSQLSRQCEQRADKRPMLSDLRESGAIEQDADVVMFLYRDDYYNPETEKKNIAEVIIAKGRNEGTGTVELVWLSQYTKFVNLEKFKGA